MNNIKKCRYCNRQIDTLKDLYFNHKKVYLCGFNCRRLFNLKS